MSFSWNSLKQRRYHLALMILLGFFNLFSLRVNLSVAIVAMTEGTSSGYEPEFNWNSQEQGYILGSFFFGYLCTQVLGGVLAKKYGGCRIFGLGIISTAILTVFTPLAAQSGLVFIILLRVLEGITSGISYPASYSIWFKWAPPMERSQLNALGFCGMFVGTIAMMPISGLLAEQFGWRSVFYFTGALAGAWYILWLIFASESPSVDRYITDDEKKYILGSLEPEMSHELKTPWRSIFTSGPVLAICITNFASDWGLHTMFTQFPTYLSQILDISLDSNGLISSLPFLAFTIFVLPVSFTTDWVRKRQFFTTTQVRKTLSCSGQLSQAVFMISAAAVAHPIYSTMFLTFDGAMGSFASASYAVNSLDIAPQYASVIMGVANSLGTVSGMISPILTGFIVQNGEILEWSIVFAIASGFYVVGAIAYFFFGSGELQAWAKTQGKIVEEDTEIKSDKLKI